MQRNEVSDHLVSFIDFFKATEEHYQHRVVNCSDRGGARTGYKSRVSLGCLTCDKIFTTVLDIPKELSKYPFVQTIVSDLGNLSYKDPGESLRQFVMKHSADIQKLQRLYSFI